MNFTFLFSFSLLYWYFLRPFCILRVNVYFSAPFCFGLFFFRDVSFMWPDLIISLHHFTHYHLDSVAAPLRTPPAALSRSTTSHSTSCTLSLHHFTFHQLHADTLLIILTCAVYYSSCGRRCNELL